MSKPIKSNVPLTTGQVAKCCGVAPRTVVKWGESGRLKMHRIPGSSDRRFYHDDVAAFLRQHGMRVPTELEARRVVYAFAVQPHEELPATSAGAHVATTAFDLGILCAMTPPLAVVIGDAEGTYTALAVATRVKALCPECAVSLILGDDAPAVESNGYAVHRRPLDWSKLLSAPREGAA